MVCYTENTSDLFLLGLDNTFKVNVIAFQPNTEICWIVGSSKNFCHLPSLYFRRTLLVHIEPIIKNKQMSEEDNFDKDYVVNTKSIGGGGVEEKSSDDEIIFFLLTLFRVGVFLSVDYLTVANLARLEILVRC